MEKSSMNEKEIIADMQLVVQQMFDDDVDENPDILDEYFDCSCCGKNKCLAGSIQYGNHRLCNDCVLLAEVGLKLEKFKDIDDLIKVMEDKRLEEICDFIKKDQASISN
ncbi:MAG: hypothetical protein E7Z91_03275 [Cyanobacteria bacterium SIG30]|nr:hypothetical protein [Cyanobacteria bacterium SIG30]